MKFQVFRERAKHSSEVFDFFNFKLLDAFHTQEVLSVIYGKDWESVLIVDEDKAFLYAFAKQRINDTQWYDIEPFLGYSGPVVNTNDIVFINSALKIYSELCREENIIAEIIRFNPLLQNHKLFEDSSLISIFPVKEIVVTNCFEDEGRQLQEFRSSTRRNILNYANKNYGFRISNNPQEMKPFLEMYYSFLDSIEASKEWYFSANFFKRAEKSSYFKLAEVFDNNGVCSTSLIIEHSFASYYFLCANRIPRLKGAHEFLILKTSTDAAKNGINKLVLGGGNSTSPDDSLLLYKKKFAQESKTFYMGKFIHNEEVFTRLCNESIARRPEIADTNFFLKYRI